MRRRESTAKRYAKAVFLLAGEAGNVEATGRELQTACESIVGHRELGDFLLRSWIKGAAKKSVITTVAEAVGCSPLAKDFLGLLAERGRVDHLPEVVRLYQQFADEVQGRGRAEVRCAVALTESERQALAEGLGRAVGKRVLVEETVDSTVLAGFVARIGSLVFDGSLRGQLARLRERLVRG